MKKGDVIRVRMTSKVPRLRNEKFIVEEVRKYTVIARHKKGNLGMFVLYKTEIDQDWGNKESF